MYYLQALFEKGIGGEDKWHIPSVNGRRQEQPATEACCHAKMLRRTVCKNCGYLDGKQVIKVGEEA